MVVDVVFNRVMSDQFPNSVEEVLMQDGQFTTYINGAYELVEPSEDTHEAISGPVAHVSGPVMAAPGPMQEEGDETEIFEVVEQNPSFPGGDNELMKWLQKNLKYPPMAQENGIQGRVMVQFVVNKDGSIVDPKVIRGADPSLDKEAMRVVQAMPKWVPGKQRGKAVRVRFTLPVTFRLQ